MAEQRRAGPRGRFVSSSISSNEELAAVSFRADFFFGRCISHLDCEGRLTGNPRLLKSKVVPLRDEISERSIPGLIEELAKATDADGVPLLISYEVEGTKVLYFPRFASQQRGLRKEREAPSRLPDYSAKARLLAGVSPDLLRSNSGKSVGQGEVEVEGEVEGGKVMQQHPPSAGVPPATANSQTRSVSLLIAGELVNQIKRLVRQHPESGQRYIPRDQVEVLGADIGRAYDAVGGNSRFLTAQGKELSFVTREFREALGAVRAELPPGEVSTTSATRGAA